MKLQIALLGWILGGVMALATTQRPSTIVYGTIRDSYGIVLSPDAATVSAFLGTNEVARTTIRVVPGGANFRFEVNVIDPLTAGPADVVPGATLTLRVKMGAVFQGIIGTNTFLAQDNGASVRRNLIVGVDSDGDGLPDDWERMVIANSGGRITSLAQVGMGRDLDGDGMSDDQEFLAGSFAFLPGDELRMSALAQSTNGRLSFTFNPIPGGIYWVDASPSISSPAWTMHPIALTETGPLAATQFSGASQAMTVYFAPGGATYFYRLRSQ